MSSDSTYIPSILSMVKNAQTLIHTANENDYLERKMLDNLI
ncbi:hypothetical protein SLEP1_g44492 [Rubroshorea leprosula]|uniref:Uncharacterized protein n=1 Tax=Rubroshorea leprosula TaxID=152421 RepID=A0AAV5LGC8_9ROSI|nr:hypothetical protein SLEP1_g44492 [Rubroshorea leprosula]